MRSNGANGENNCSRLRLLVGDTQPMVAAALTALLAQSGHEVVATASTGAEVETALAAGGVDIAVLDIDLAEPGPLALVASLRRDRQRLPIIVTAPDAEHPELPHAIESGIDGVTLKSEAAINLDHCIVTVAAGGQWFDRRALVRALDRREAMGGATLLTRRERDVARLVATGQRNRDIAGALGISEGTVKMHLHNVYAKLGLESRTQLAMDDRLKMLV